MEGENVISWLRVGLGTCFPMYAGGEINPYLLVISLPLLEMEGIGTSCPFLEPFELPTWLSDCSCLLGQLLLDGLGELEHCWMFVLENLSEANIALSLLPINLMRFFRMAPLGFDKSEKEYWNQLNFSLGRKSITGGLSVTTKDRSSSEPWPWKIIIQLVGKWEAGGVLELCNWRQEACWSDKFCKSLSPHSWWCL